MTTTDFHPVHDVYDGLFNTSSGTKIDLNNPTPGAIRLDDIAHALSNICRFGGHCKPFYSVAQHSVLVAALAPNELKKEALMHDATEAYVGDVIKPLKVMLGNVYEDLEDKFMQAIAYRFGLDHSKLLKVKKFDKMALELEHECFQKNNPAPLVAAMESTGLLSADMYAWHPNLAKQTFLQLSTRFLNNPL